MRRLSSLGSKNLAHRKGRSVLTALGIVLGVAILFGVQVANATTEAGFDALVADFTGESDVIVTPAGAIDAVMPENAEGRLRDLPDVEAAVGMLGFLTSLRAPGEDEPFTSGFRGITLAHARQIQPYDLDRGREFRIGAQEVLVPNRLAAKLRKGVGDTIRVPTRVGPRDMRIVGTLEDVGAARTNQGDILFTSLETARALDGRPRALSRVYVVLRDGVDVARWIERHKERLGAGYDFANAATLADGFKDFLNIFGFTLSFFAAITLFVGSFLIYLTLSMAVIERVRTYGTMRALGASRAQIRRVVLGEALVLGAVSTVLGLLLGLGIARGLLVMIANLFEIDIPGLTVTGASVAIALVIGMAITAIASLVPARRAARLSPVVAMKGDYAAETRLSRAWIAGLSFTALGLGIGLTADASVGASSTPLILLGAVLLVPLLLRPLARVLGRITSRLARGAGDVAVLHLVKERSRSAYTLGLIMVVMAMIFSIGGLFASMGRALDQTLDRQFGADVQIEAAETLGEQFERELAASDGIETYTAVRYAETRFLDDPDAQRASGENFALVNIVDPATYFNVEGFQWVKGSDREAKRAMERGGVAFLPERQQAALSEKLAAVGEKLGTHVTLQTSKGPVEFEIAGTYASFFGPPEVTVGLRDGRRYFQARDASAFHANVAEGSDAEQVRDRLERDLGSRYNARVMTSVSLKDDAREEFNQYFNIIYAILLVAAIVGLLGLANTLAMSVLQRYREIGVLRAIGTTRGQVRRMVLVESATLSLVAFALAVPLGLGLSMITVRAISDAFGFDVDYVYPASWVPVLVVFGALVAVLAALAPGRRAARLQIVSALQYE